MNKMSVTYINEIINVRSFCTDRFDMGSHRRLSSAKRQNVTVFEIIES